MDPDRYCLEEAAPSGSSLFYATLFAGPRERAALVAIHALRQSLVGIVDSIADSNVRAHKLNWWSNEIMEARDGCARHPIALSITRHCGTPFWSRREVLAMLSAVGTVSAANGIVSVAARDRFCDDVGGGTARLCSTVRQIETGDAALKHVRVLGARLEAAALAGVPMVQSGLQRIPESVSGTPGQTAHGDSHNPERRLAEERIRVRNSLEDAIRDAPRGAGPAMLVYRTLALIQVAALANALRKRHRTVPPVASIAPIRKLWIAWRTARREGCDQ